LNIRGLAIDKKDEIDNFIMFAKLAHDNGNTDLSSSILHELKHELKSSGDQLKKQISINNSGSSLYSSNYASHSSSQLGLTFSEQQ